MKVFEKVGIIGVHHTLKVSTSIKFLLEFLEKKFTLWIEKETSLNLGLNVYGYSLEDIANNCHVAIIVGGDGNFLNFGRRLSLYKNIPIVGINRGKLGFLTDINPREIPYHLSDILVRKKFYKEKRFMISGKVYRYKQKRYLNFALNDVVLASNQHSPLFRMKININKKCAFAQRANGIIVSTPTGSTAHALSAGGPIVHPLIDALIIVPIFSHSLNSRPIVISANSLLEIEVIDRVRTLPMLSFDGSMKQQLDLGGRLVIKKCKPYLTILHPIDYNYFGSLRSKLHWNKTLS